MDYRIIEKNVFADFKKNIKSKFEKALKEQKTFDNAFKSIQNEIEETKNSSYISKNSTKLSDCIQFIHLREDYYATEFALSLIINNEIKNCYEKSSDKSIPFDEFVKELINYDCLRRLQIRVNENKILYQLFYDNKDFKGFTIEHFKGHVVNSIVFKKYFRKYYPGKPLPVVTEKKDNYGNTLIEINNSPNKSQKNTGISSKNEIYNIELTIDEKAMLLHICLVDKEPIPLTEKIKLICIIGEIEDDSLFVKSSAQSTFYQKVKTGIYRNGSKTTLLELVNQLLEKIQNIEIESIKKRLRHYKLIIKNNKN